MECSVVVAGSGFGGARVDRALPAAGDARGGTDGERGERADGHALGARARGDEAQLGGAPAGAGAPERELPWLLFGEVAGLCARAARSAAPIGRRRRSALRRARGRPARARRSRERSSDALQWSRTARSRGDPDMRRRPFSNPFPCAYGVSCRARVNDYATPHLWRFAPAAFRLQWVPRSRTPWGEGLGTNGRQANRYRCKMRYRGRSCKRCCRREPAREAMSAAKFAV